MNCETLRQMRAAGAWPQGAAVEAHLAECDTCAEELAREALPRGMRPESVPTTEMGNLIAEVERVKESEAGLVAWLRSRSTPARYGIGAGVALLVVAAWWAFRRRVDWGMIPAERMGVELGAVLLVGVAAIALALRPLQRPALPGWAKASLAIGAVGVTAVVASLPPAHLAHPDSLHGIGDDFLARAIGCLLAGTLSAVAPLAFLWALDRQGGKARSSAILLTVGASLVGFATLHVHCPLVHSRHLWAGHVAMIALVWALGAIAYAVRGRVGTVVGRTEL